MKTPETRLRMAKYSLWAASSAIALMTPVSAFAQDASANASAQSKDIVVTAQFREQNLQDTPLSITAVTAELLEARGQTTINEVANQAPNVTLKQEGGSFGISMAASIRGVGQRDFNPALEPGVGIYVDDVYIPTLTGAMLELLDLERVEVLRGPQGTLTGRNSIGGAIKLFSKKPTGQGGGFMEATAGDFDKIGFRGAVDFKINDVLAARISGISKSQDGYVDRIDYGCANPTSGVVSTRVGNCTVEKLGDYTFNAIRGALQFTPNDRFTANLSADYVNDQRSSAEVLGQVVGASPWVGLTSSINGSPIPYDNRFVCGPLCNFAAFAQPATGFAGPVAAGFPLQATSGPSEQTFEGRGVSANLQYDFNDNLNLVSITGYREYESGWSDDGDLSPASVQFGQNLLNHEFFSQELRLNAQLNDAFNFTVGAYYSDQTTKYFTYQDIRYAAIPLQFYGTDPVNATSKGVFATGTWNPTEPLTVTAGIRYTEDEKDYTFQRLSPGGFPNPFLGSLNGRVGTFTGDSTDYRISVDYRWSPNVLTYATVSTGFKGGGINPRPFNPAQVQPFNSETLTAYELGAKTDFFDRRLRVNASYFFNDYKDIQLALLSCPQFGGPGPCALPVNVGSADVQGFELEVTAEPIDGFNIDASVSTLDFEYTRTDVANTGITSADIAPYTPELKWSLGAQYAFNLADKGTITPRFDVAYQDEFFTNASNNARNKVDSYTVANMRLGWDSADKDLSIALVGTNITDEYYIVNNFDLAAVPGAGTVKQLPARPREWAIVVRKEF